jgi:hypothetical protein
MALQSAKTPGIHFLANQGVLVHVTHLVVHGEQTSRFLAGGNHGAAVGH